jgi:hypothetical protein
MLKSYTYLLAIYFWSTRGHTLWCAPPALLLERGQLTTIRLNCERKRRCELTDYVCAYFMQAWFTHWQFCPNFCSDSDWKYIRRLGCEGLCGLGWRVTVIIRSMWLVLVSITQCNNVWMQSRTRKINPPTSPCSAKMVALEKISEADL